MIGAGTFINPLMKIITTVAILGAAYLFIVKPALDTSERISSDVTQSISDAQEEALEALPEVPNGAKIQRQVEKSIQGGSGSDADIKRVQKMADCMQAASGDVNAVNRCVDKFSP